MGKVLYLDCQAGIAGDMALAALVHAGADLEAVRDAVRRVAGREVPIAAVPHEKGAIRGLRVEVDAAGDRTERTAREILDAIGAAGLDGAVADAASRVFRRLAEAEAEVHGVSPEAVHFHEVGALDSIADVVGVAAALHSLGVTRVEASVLPMGRGTVATRHGLMPLPAPATVAVLRGWPVAGVDLEGETVTPTGAAIVAALASASGPMPVMRVESVGYGFGTREWPDGRPNCVRAIVGAGEEPAPPAEWEIAANIDDMTPDDAAQLASALLAAGAFDAWIEPIVMKKGRPAWSVHAVVAAAARDAVVGAFFEESTTIGVRMHPLERVKLGYEVRVVETSLGPVRVKVATRDGRVVNQSLESDDVHRIARERGMSVKRVKETVLRET
jgi:uncharacterized protein (TIGR00299 family) protein